MGTLSACIAQHEQLCPRDALRACIAPEMNTLHLQMHEVGACIFIDLDHVLHSTLAYRPISQLYWPHLSTVTKHQNATVYLFEDAVQILGWFSGAVSVAHYMPHRKTPAALPSQPSAKTCLMEFFPLCPFVHLVILWYAHKDVWSQPVVHSLSECRSLYASTSNNRHGTYKLSCLPPFTHESPPVTDT